MKIENFINSIFRKSALIVGALFMLMALCLPSSALAEECTVSILNRTATVRPDGSWLLPNVPSNMGQVRARMTCVINGETKSGQSDYFTVQSNGIIDVGDIYFFDGFEEVPNALTITAPTTTLTAIGEATQLTVTASYPLGSTSDVTAASLGTTYLSTNPAIASVSADGVVTASTQTGRVIITASNEMVLSSLFFTVTQGANPDTDGDGMPDDWEIANGLNPNDPIDALKDPDSDGLTNVDEYFYGTDLSVADTDGDGIDDGEEVVAGDDGFVTNPLLADTDGDGISDGLEVLTSSDPTDFMSVNLAQALSSIVVTPSVNDIIFNTVDSEATKQLTVTGNLIDGGTIDLTANSRGTNYASSSIAIAGFSITPGLVYAGSSGTATITATNNGFSDTASVTVETFSPTALSFVTLPVGSSANNVDVDGDYLYVAGGTGGMFVVDVADRSAPFIAATLDTPGSANDVKISGSLALVADGTSGLQIIDITNPLVPVTAGALATTNALDVVFAGTTAYVADGTAGLKIIDFTIPASPVFLGSIDTPDNAMGVDIDPLNNIAVVADFSSTQVIDVVNPASPQIVGSVASSYQARDLIVRDNIVYLADYPQGGLKAIDISVPSVPVVVGVETTGGYLLDVEAQGNLLFGADKFRVNAVPIYNISTPSSPVFSSLLDFSVYGDDNGSGIDVDKEYLYLATNKDRVLIGQYKMFRDTGTIPPVVDITSPQDGAIAIEGESLTITADATDDVEVVGVDILVDGVAICTDESAPYSCEYTVPLGITFFDVGAQAVDLAGNIGVALGVTVNVVPDPLTTVTGFVVDSGGVPVGGVSVTTIDGIASTTLADGSFAIPDVPTIRGGLTVDAAAIIGGFDYGGKSFSVFPVASGNTDVGTIEIGPVPMILSFAPQGGVIGDSVTITGESFDTVVPANNLVFFSNNVQATVVSATTTTITTTLPAGATTGPISVGNIYGTAVSASTFEVTTTISADIIIQANDTSYDGRTIIVDGAVLTINGEHSFSNLSIVNGGLITHSDATSTSESSLVMDISGVLTIDSTSTIDVSGKGYLGGASGDNTSYYGRTLGNTIIGSSDSYSGGGYGGLGGQPSVARVINDVYGSFYDPNELGSGGGGNGPAGQYSSYPGGDGGGLVRITAGEINLDGAIISDGLMGPVGRSGSGSGGGVKIQTGVLSGTGSIRANGAGVVSTTANSSGGGGGRIAVYYNDISSFDTSMITTYGGLGNQDAIRNGGAGTIYFEDLVTGAKRLSADNGGLAATATPLNSSDGLGFTFDSFTISDAYVTIDHMTVDTILTLDNSILDASAGVSAADITVRNNSTLNITAGMTATNVNVLTGSTITHSDATSTSESSLVMDISGVLTIDSTSTIDVSGKGYLGGASGDNTSYYGRTLGNTIIGSSDSYSGGGYGGLGGQPSVARVINDVYGSFYDPNELGSGGGGNGPAGQYSSYPGGDGGGLVRITAGEINLDGAIISDGLMGPVGRSGSGSGGGVKIQTGVLSGTGSIRANGAGVVSTTANSSGGGGGRIAVYYNDISSFDTSMITTYGGLGNQDAIRNGGAGTIYFEDLVTGAKRLSADNGGLAATATPLNSSDGLGFTFDSFTISDAYVTIDHMTVDTILTLDNSILDASAGVSAADITVRNNSTLNITAGMTATNVNVLTGSTITHSDATSTSESSLVMDISGVLTIDSTSTIDVSGKGYLGGASGDNTSYYGRTLGNTIIGSSDSYSGGGYGGLGGQPSVARVINDVYGSFYDPNELGSGGGGNGPAGQYSSYPGGDGGGLVRITAGEINLDGAIISDGLMGPVGRSGSGSGGGVKIQTGVLSGTGSIRANGAGVVSTTANSSGGGGGRIAVYYNDISSFDTSMITTYGGLGNQDAIRNGGAGTIYFEDLVTGAKRLSADNGGLAATATPLNSSDGLGFTFDSFTISDAYVTIDHMTVDTILTLDNSILDASAGVSAADITVRNNSTLNITAGMTATNVNVLTGSTITHSDATSTSESSLVMDISGVLTIDSTSTIDVSGKGYLGGASGDNTSYYGRTLGNTIIGSSDSYSGGGYGGLGGQPSVARVINDVYGSFYDPNELGSGGGGNGPAGQYSSYPGGDGGGLVRITAGEINLDGAIISDGLMGPVGRSGSGSGGGVKIQTGVLSGTGSIRANGAGVVSTTANSSGGGGGRIAVYYNDISSFDTSMITTYGGLGNQDAIRNGGAGTIYFEDLVTGAKRLSADNGGLAATATPLNSSDGLGFTFDSFTISDAYVTIDHMTVDTILTLDNSILDASAGVSAADITVRNNSTLNITAGMTATNVNVLTGSTITHSDATSTSESSLVMDISGVLTIDSTSTIDVSGKGYLGGASGDNTSYYGRTLGNTIIGSSDSYSGGGYGGLGGQPSVARVINDVYGSFYDPNELGSGGGGNGPAGQYSSYPGGDGGGLVRITAGEINLDGLINADGIGPRWGYAGGGSGGGVKIEVGTLSGLGAITANGGTHHVDRPTNTTGGGGGRIAIYYNDAIGFNTANITTYGGTGQFANGGAGTIYLESSAQQYGDLIVDNNNVVSTAYSTPLPSVGTGLSTALTVDTLTDSTQTWGTNSLYGIYLNPNMAQLDPPELFFISANDQTSITVLNTPYNLTDIATIGDTYIGEHHFDNLYVISGASVETLDDVYYNTLVITGGTLQAANTYQVGKNVLKEKSIFAKLIRFFKGVVTIEAKAGGEEEKEKVTTGYDLQEDEIISSSKDRETLKDAGIIGEISRKAIKSDMDGLFSYN